MSKEEEKGFLYWIIWPFKLAFDTTVFLLWTVPRWIFQVFVETPTLWLFAMIREIAIII